MTVNAPLLWEKNISNDDDFSHKPLMPPSTRRRSLFSKVTSRYDANQRTISAGVSKGRAESADFGWLLCCMRARSDRVPSTSTRYFDSVPSAPLSRVARARTRPGTLEASKVACVAASLPTTAATSARISGRHLRSSRLSARRCAALALAAFASFDVRGLGIGHGSLAQ